MLSSDLFFFSKEYQSVRQASVDELRSPEVQDQLLDLKYHTDLIRKHKGKIILALLIISMFINLFVLTIHFSFPQVPEKHEKSKFAGLTRTIPKAMVQYTEWTSPNLTAVWELWEEWNGDKGVVALHDDYVQEMDIPHGFRYPWDENYGIYLLRGFHNMHCLRTIFRYVKNVEEHSHQQVGYEHVLHCLDQLRQDVLCNADDTPRWADYENSPGTGEGQVKMCKDWDALAAWSKEHTACFEHKDEFREPIKNRFKARRGFMTESNTAN